MTWLLVLLAGVNAVLCIGIVLVVFYMMDRQNKLINTMTIRFMAKNIRESALAETLVSDGKEDKAAAVEYPSKFSSSLGQLEGALIGGSDMDDERPIKNELGQTLEPV